MPARRLHDRDAGRRDALGEVLDRADAIAQVVLFEDLLEANRDRFEVVLGEAAVRREALGEDEQVAAASGQLGIVHREEPADVGEPVLLCRECAAVGEGEQLARDRRRRLARVALLAELDEVGVLGEPAGVEEQRDAVPIADRAHRASILERDRLAAARVVRDGEHDQRDVLHADLGDGRLERVDVHVAFEGV